MRFPKKVGLLSNMWDASFVTFVQWKRRCARQPRCSTSSWVSTEMGEPLAGLETWYPIQAILITAIRAWVSLKPCSHTVRRRTSTLDVLTSRQRAATAALYMQIICKYSNKIAAYAVRSWRSFDIRACMSVRLSVWLWRCALWLNDTSYS